MPRKRLSENPENLHAVYDKMMNVMNRLEDGTMSVEAAEAEAKAGHVAGKMIETDLHARIFAHKIANSGVGLGISSQAEQQALPAPTATQ